jgi:hypothetical protein
VKLRRIKWLPEAYHYGDEKDSIFFPVLGYSQDDESRALKKKNDQK